MNIARSSKRGGRAYRLHSAQERVALRRLALETSWLEEDMLSWTSRTGWRKGQDGGGERDGPRLVGCGRGVAVGALIGRQRLKQGSREAALGSGRAQGSTRPAQRRAAASSPSRLVLRYSRCHPRRPRPRPRRRHGRGH